MKKPILYESLTCQLYFFGSLPSQLPNSDVYSLPTAPPLVLHRQTVSATRLDTARLFLTSRLIWTEGSVKGDTRSRLVLAQRSMRDVLSAMHLIGGQRGSSTTRKVPVDSMSLEQCKKPKINTEEFDH